MFTQYTFSVGNRDCSGDGVTGDGGYGDITGDKIFTGEVTGYGIVTGEAFSPVKFIYSARQQDDVFLMHRKQNRG